MKALLKNGEWVEIDTTCLFNNQYNAAGKRIFDQDIKRIVDDVRDGLGKCRYCGAIVKRGEEHKHFEEKENKSCKNCFWYQNRLIETKKERSFYEKVCAYKEKYGGCTNTECRRMGIEWFTPENTFFLKYPNGFESIPDVDKLAIRGFVMNDRCLNAEYHKKIGSYTLTAILEYENGKAIGISAYRIWNCRRDYTFRFENNELFTNKYSFGWRKVKTLEDIPDSVMEIIKNICMR